MPTRSCELSPELIPYDSCIASSQGAYYTLYPIRGEHTQAQVDSAARWIRNSFDCLKLIVEWNKPDTEPLAGRVRTYASRKELLNAEHGLIYVDQTHGLQAIDGMDGRAARRHFTKPLLIDNFTLSMLRTVYNNLNEKNQAKMDSFSWVGAVDIGWQAMNRNSNRS